MSGHSKWSTIKRKKGKADAERGRLFSRLIKEITVAARHGGGDESSNPRLRSAIQEAKASNMPQANIEKAIKKGTGELPGVVYEEARYEAYGPGGIAIMLDVLTDNKKRTVAEIRHALERGGGNLAANGSVAWMFDQRGAIAIPKKDLTEDDVFLVVADAGANDIREEADAFEVTTPPEALEGVKRALTENNIEYDHAEVTYVAQTDVKLSGDAAKRVLKLMEALDELDDTSKIYSNFDVDEETLAEVMVS
jgi:YebC/PmpR family DNA-binding regulatory protein